MPDIHHGIWTEQRVDTLRQLWAAGASSEDIAVRLNTTSGAVRSKIKRLRLNKTRLKRQRPFKKPTTSPEMPPHYRSTPRYPSPVQGCPEPNMGLGTLLHERTGCAWPVNAGGPYRFCDGAIFEECGYCFEHETLRTRK
jgi:hypothetical protein